MRNDSLLLFCVRLGENINIVDGDDGSDQSSMVPCKFGPLIDPFQSHVHRGPRGAINTPVEADTITTRFVFTGLKRPHVREIKAHVTTAFPMFRDCDIRRPGGSGWQRFAPRAVFV